MFVVEITEQKLDKATELAEKMLKYGGQLMQCLSEWEEEAGERDGGSMGNRGRYGEREEQGNRYGNRGERMGYRDDDDEDWMQERRRRGGGGRYK